MKTLKVYCDSEGIKNAVRTIKNGGIVVFPTDTVYGVGCDPYNEDAVKSIYKIKKREPKKLFPILGYSEKDLSKIAFFDEKAIKIAKKFWPGQLTMVLKIKDEKLKRSLNVDKKIAVRVPNNHCILSILEKCRIIVGTSANQSGKQSFMNPNECMKQFSGYDLFVDGGVISSKGESTVMEIDNDITILREGIISKKEIMNLF
jgi:L-threonylcarbamoyladenylate synthase